MVIEMYIGAAVAVALIACLSIYTGVHIRKTRKQIVMDPELLQA